MFQNELFSQAQKVLQDLSQSYYSANSLHLKKGILLALAAAAIGFGKEAKPFLTGTLLPFKIPKSPDGPFKAFKDAMKYVKSKLKDLLEPILSAIVETDSRLRYFACESLYNVTKVVRTQLIPGKQLENQPLGGAFWISRPYFRSICTIVYFNIPAHIRF